MMIKSIFLGVLAILLWLPEPGIATEKQATVTLMTHDSFAVSKEVLKQFETQHAVTVKILKAGDAGAALNQAILTKANPFADVFFGVDNTFMSRALRADIFEVYDTPLLANIPENLKLDRNKRLHPVDYGDVCLNYDKQWFVEKQLRPPQNLADLIKPEYRGLTVVENPATSSPGLAFLLATVGQFGEDGYLEFWEKLRDNQVYVAMGWSDAYYGQFTRAKGGTRPIVVSYASSPAAEVYYSEKKLQAAPTAAVIGRKAAFRQIEFVGVLKGSKQPDLARKLVDFMLSPEFQRDIPLNMWVFPADAGVPLPDIFLKYAHKAQIPVVLSPEAIETGREKWIDAWTEVVLR